MVPLVSSLSSDPCGCHGKMVRALSAHHSHGSVQPMAYGNKPHIMNYIYSELGQQ